MSTASRFIGFKSVLLGAAITVAGAAYTPDASAITLNLLQNGSFEDGDNPPGSYVTMPDANSSLSVWTVGGSVDWVGNYWQASEGQRSLDLNGLGVGSVSQTVNLQPGQYQLTFSLAGNPDGQNDQNTPLEKILGVSIAPTATGLPAQYTFDVDAKNNTLSDMKWETKTLFFTIQSLGDYTLTFGSLIEGNFGPALDNVSLTAVPLPAAAWLFISALGGLALIGRRRRMHGATA